MLLQKLMNDPTTVHAVVGSFIHHAAGLSVLVFLEMAPFGGWWDGIRLHNTINVKAVKPKQWAKSDSTDWFWISLMTSFSDDQELKNWQKWFPPNSSRRV